MNTELITAAALTAGPNDKVVFLLPPDTSLAVSEAFLDVAQDILGDRVLVAVGPTNMAVVRDLDPGTTYRSFADLPTPAGRLEDGEVVDL